MFWLAFGTAAAVIGLALMTIGVSRAAASSNLLGSPWFDGGLGLLLLGVGLLLWALRLFLSRGRGVQAAGASDAGETPKPDKETEAVRGYYAERDKLFKMWERQQKDRRRKS